MSLSSGNGGRVTLHDVIRDYLLSTHDPAQLAMLHGRLVDASAEDLPEEAPPSTAYPGSRYRAWWELADGYLQDHLIEHLVAAGRIEQAETAAGDLRWVENRLVRHGANAAPRDLSHVPTTNAALRARTLAQLTYLLAPTDPAPLVLSTLYSRLAFSPLWRDQVNARLPSVPSGPLLVARWPPPDPPDPALLTTLTGHTGPVASVAISPDGSWLATAGRDKTVRLWDRATGRCTATLSHTYRVETVVISPDGTWLATTDVVATVRQWDRATCRGSALTDRTVRGRPTRAVAVSPDGTWLATASVDGTVRLWDRETGRCTATLTGHTDWVTSVTTSPDGMWLAAAGKDGEIHVWNVRGRRTAAFVRVDGELNACAWIPHGRTLVAAGNRGVHAFEFHIRQLAAGVTR